MGEAGEEGRVKQLPPPKSRKTLILRYPLWGGKVMKVTTLIVALLALALGTGTAIIVSVQMQPVVACASSSC